MGQRPGRFDNWTYATANNGRIPGAPYLPPSAEGHGADSPEVGVQHRFQHIGQLWLLIREDHAFLCPTDVSTAYQHPVFYLARANKVSSYMMNPAVIGALETITSVGDKGLTYQLHQFLGNAVSYWEGDESDPFVFNDVTSLPSEGASSRHSKGSHMGCFDGRVEWWSNRQFRSQAAANTPGTLPNRLWCNPGNPYGH